MSQYECVVSPLKLPLSSLLPTRIDPPRGDGYAEFMALTHRTVRFSLSPALADNQQWAVEAFPAIVRRATGCGERWALVMQTTDNDSETRTWRYEVEGIPDIDIVVDHIIHELTDAVLLSEQHTVTEDAFTFGSMHRERPERSATHSIGQEQEPTQGPEQVAGGSER